MYVLSYTLLTFYHANSWSNSLSDAVTELVRLQGIIKCIFKSNLI